MLLGWPLQVVGGYAKTGQGAGDEPARICSPPHHLPRGFGAVQEVPESDADCGTCLCRVVVCPRVRLSARVQGTRSFRAHVFMDMCHFSTCKPIPSKRHAHMTAHIIKPNKSSQRSEAAPKKRMPCTQRHYGSPRDIIL